MKTDRLLELADFLETVVANLPDVERRFSMSYWFRRMAGVTEDRPNPVTCGTSGCALGWAASLWPGDFDVVPPRCSTDSGHILLKDQPDIEGGQAAQVFFGLTEQQAEHLFIPSSRGLGVDQRTPIEEATIIRNMVQAYETGTLDAMLSDCDCCGEEYEEEEEFEDEDTYEEEEEEEFEDDEDSQEEPDPRP